MSDHDKSKEQLIAELDGLRQRLDALEDTAASDTKADDSEIQLARRGLVQAGWVAPVIMAVNLPTSVFAGTGSPNGDPTPSAPVAV